MVLELTCKLCKAQNTMLPWSLWNCRYSGEEPCYTRCCYKIDCF